MAGTYYITGNNIVADVKMEKGFKLEDFILKLDENNSATTDEEGIHVVHLQSYGTVVKDTPFSIFGWLWGILNFFYLLFQTLINPNFNKHGDKYVRDFRPPGSGPPKPPSKKFGGFGSSGDGPSPPPMGGCGCGG